MSTPSAAEEDYTLSRAHGTVMVIAWMMFASTGILFARYGRTLQIGTRAKILGESIWFQVHRLALCTAAIGTLLGFFLILAQAKSTWVDVSEGRLFAHSVLGGIIVCCAQIQVWMALFRCHPDSRFRFIFNWLHRLTGLLAFILSIPTIFLIAFVLLNYRNGLITILSLWSAWVVIIVIVFEILEYRFRKVSRDTRTDSSTNAGEHSVHNSYVQQFSKIKLILFGIHIVIAIGLSIPLIVLIWMQG